MSRCEILHIVGSGSHDAIAVTRCVFALARSLDPCRYRLSAWFLMSDGPLREKLEVAGVATRVVPWRNGARDPLGAFRFSRELARHHFDIVHTHVGGRALHSLVVAGHRRLVVHLHGRDPAVDMLTIDTYLERADRVIASSNAVAGWSRDPRCAVVYPGVDPQPSSTLARSSERFTVGAAARLSPEKGLSDLIEATGILSCDGVSVRLDIAGDGPEEPALRRQVSRLGLNDAVVFHGWRDDVPALMSTWDLFVQPSIHESAANATLEAMTAGLPVIASRTGGLPELIENGRTGLLVPPQSPRALADAMRQLIEDPEAARAMAEAGRDRVRSFSVAAMTGGIESVYESLLREDALPARRSALAALFGRTHGWFPRA
jgi:glycosyltransferase involved in cell wall biosynthesis